jgi:pimeloyl-ACP methyl ester carboxylesterase
MIGEHEKAFSPIKCLKRVREKGSGAEIKIVKNAGHDIVMVQPEIVSEKLRTFFLK